MYYHLSWAQYWQGTLGEGADFMEGDDKRTDDGGTTPPAEGTARLNVVITKGQLRRLKQHCLDNDITMSDFVRDAIDRL